MKTRISATIATLCASAALASACASSGAKAPSTSAAIASDAATRAEAIAIRLARGEQAYEAGDKGTLTDVVTALTASRIKPLDESQTDTLAMWQAASGAKLPPFRGRLLGPAYVRGELAPGEVWRSAQTFKSGEASTLSVAHKGLGPVRMKVSDAKAREVCTQRPLKSLACRFTPMFTQRYEIELTNEGDGNAVYFLVFD
ncbi:MAG: hypothetical protein AAF251_12015 [Pseudomonadota bacterium]